VLRFGILILFFLTGCVTSLSQLHQIEPKGTPFQTYLAGEYLSFADSEADQYDWFESAHFAKKGLKLAKGADVEPEDLAQWDIPAEVLPTMVQAREYLIQTLTPEMKNDHPKETAHAEFLFDCWVEQQEENWQAEDISYCRENFYTTLDALYNFGGGPDVPLLKAEEAAPAPVVCSAECNHTTEKRTVYFDFDKYTLNDRTKRTVSDVISKLKDVTKYEVTLNGYADRVGPEDHNMELSKRRATAIKKALVAGGINADSITIFAFGELHGLVETKDNVPEKENRAVEFVIEK
jgi:OOP family OmpA-OmpF porin